MTTVLVLGAGGAAGNGFCRALANTDFTVIGANISADDAILADGVTHCEVIRSDIDLLRLVEREHVSFVHAQPDPEVIRLSELRALLHGIECHTYLPCHDQIVACQDKREYATRMPDLCPEITNTGDIWIRPRWGSGGKHARRSKNEITTGRWLAQRFIPGPTVTYTCLWNNGILLFGQGRERLAWTHGDRGSASRCRLVNDPAAAETGLLACHIPGLDVPHGIWSVDMIRDENGKHWVTEVNIGRFFTTMPELCLAAGWNVALQYVTGQIGGPIDSLPEVEMLRQWDRSPVFRRTP